MGPCTLAEPFTSDYEEGTAPNSDLAQMFPWAPILPNMAMRHYPTHTVITGSTQWSLVLSLVPAVDAGVF